MSQKTKTTRTLIADLPEVASEVSAEALEQVVGGATSLNVLSGSALKLSCTCQPASCTICNDTDYQADS
jgi:hypothetical protein